MSNNAVIQTNEFLNANPDLKFATLIFPALRERIPRIINRYYSNGIKKAKLTIIPSTYYYTDGTVAINWNNGEIPQTGQMIRVLNKDGNAYLKDKNGNDLIFRVTGRKLRYEGQFFIDLELQEIVRMESDLD